MGRAGGGKPRPYGIEVLPLYLETFDPPREQFLILAALDPFVDDFLQFFISAQE
jgi:hypothetical protein